METKLDIDRVYDITPNNIFDQKVWGAIHNSIFELLKRKVKENKIGITSGVVIYNDKLHHYADEIFTHYRETHEIYNFNYKHLDDFAYFVERDIHNILWGDEAREFMQKLFIHFDNKNYFKSKLKEFSELKAEWIPNGREISKKAISWMEMIVDNLEDADLDDWDIAPFVNGSILVMFRKYTGAHACINVAEKSYSYFYEYPAKAIWDVDKDTLDNGFHKVTELIKRVQKD